MRLPAGSTAATRSVFSPSAGVTVRAKLPSAARGTSASFTVTRAPGSASPATATSAVVTISASFGAVRVTKGGVSSSTMRKRQLSERTPGSPSRSREETRQ